MAKSKKFCARLEKYDKILGMSPFIQSLLLFSFILLAAKTAGYLSTRLHQPSVLGELLVGLVLGPTLIDLLHLHIFEEEYVFLEELVKETAEIGVVLLMFVAGLELHLRDLKHSGRVSAFAGTLGVLVPVALGILAGLAFGSELQVAIFLGLTLGATSVSISAQTLMELKILRSKVGMGMLGAAVFDDVLVILLLSIVLAVASGGSGFLPIVWVFVRMVIFMAGSAAFGIWVLPWSMRKVERLPISQGMLAFSLVITFLYAALAEIVGGMAAITGAFLAGLMFARSPEKEQLEQNMGAVAYGLFVPIFFVSIGLSVNLRDFNMDNLWLTLVILAVAVLGKLFGAGGGALLARYERLDAAMLGAGMISRGEVGLIIASVGITQGLMSEESFSIIVLMVVVTTVITPPLLRFIHQLKKKEDEKLQQAFNKDISIEKPLPQSSGEAAVSPEIKE
jgi:Kef-type K+ transport system membrane component KefB